MGDKMRYFISLLLSMLMTFNTALSYNIETNLYHSIDTDSTMVLKHDTRINYDNGAIIGVGQNLYDSNGQRTTLNKVVLGYTNEHLTIVPEVDEEGNIGGLVRYIIPNDFAFMEVGIERELIDSTVGIDGRLSSTVYYYSIDLYHQEYDLGLALVPSYTNFDGGGSRNQIRSKLYKGIGETGIHVYVRSRNYWNSDPYNGIFFSPEKYEQYLAGIGFRRVVDEHTVLSGHYDRGRQYIDGYGEQSQSWRLALTTTVRDSIQIEGSYAIDDHSPNYSYELGMLTVRFNF